MSQNIPGYKSNHHGNPSVVYLGLVLVYLRRGLDYTLQ